MTAKILAVFFVLTHVDIYRKAPKNEIPEYWDIKPYPATFVHSLPFKQLLDHAYRHKVIYSHSQYKFLNH